MQRSSRPGWLFLSAYGTSLLAFGTAAFLLPCELVAGGVSGIAVLFHRLLPWLSAPAWVALLSWGLFLVGWLFLGRAFAARTLLSALLYPVGVALFSGVVTAPPPMPTLQAALLGGALVGAGCALAFLGGGSTGGVDVLALLLCRRMPAWRPGVVIFCIDAATILLGLPLLRDVRASALGVLSAAMAACTVELLSRGSMTILSKERGSA